MGNTIIAGAFDDNSDIGAAWIFTRSNGIWAQQGNKLVGDLSGTQLQEGYAVAISADGKTAAIGSQGGGMWIFAFNGSTWNTQYTASATNFAGIGYSIALSADGNTLLTGSPRDNNNTGAGLVFTRINGTWSQQGTSLTGSGSIGASYQGNSVSLSADGNSAIIGGYGDNSFQGAAWIFTRNNNSWIQQGNKLIGSGAVNQPQQGFSVTISGDGSTGVIGGNTDSPSGAAWVFSAAPVATTLPATGITTTTVTLNGTVGDNGSSTTVSIEYGTSADLTGSVNAAISTGTNPISAGNGVVTYVSTLTGLVPGTVYYCRINGTNSSGNTNGIILSFTTIALPPTITSFTPTTGPPGTLITVTGTSLANPTSFTIGGMPAVVVSNTGTTLVGMVMPGSITGSISVATPVGSITGTSNFTITSTPHPFGQAGAKLVGTGNIGPGNQGQAVAISSDGTTAIVGAPQDNNYIGTAWIYIRNGNTWVQQGPKLVGTGYQGQGYQGSSVAISADGNTAVVGSPNDNATTGAIWVYTRTAGVWTQQGPKLLSNTIYALSQLGSSVALSADGNTILAGAYKEQNLEGAAWVFTRSNGIWTRQGNKLVGNGDIGEALQGSSVALSADGNTAIVGGYGDNANHGAAWVFTRSNTTWSQQGNKLIAGNSATATLGTSIALSADGNTAIIGGSTDNYDEGGAWVFGRTNGLWAQQGGKLVGTGNTQISNEGSSVGISADGNTIVIGAYADSSYTGGFWTFIKNGTAWIQQGAKMYGIGYTTAAQQGAALALSADGSTLIMGGNTDNANLGAAWVFSAFPIAVTQQPSAVTATGAIINGYVSDNGSTTTVSMEYSTASDMSSAVQVVPGNGINPIPQGTGQTNFSATLSNLNPGTTYYFRINGTNINGSSNGAIYNFSTVAGVPIINSFSPNNGPPGTIVNISGSNLDNLAGVTIGGTSAITISNTGTNLICMVMPGTINGLVSITTSGGATLSNSNFTVTTTSFPSSQQGGKLIAQGNFDFQGGSVAVSADGGTAVVGGSQLWIYARINGLWTLQGGRLAISGLLATRWLLVPMVIRLSPDQTGWATISKVPPGFLSAIIMFGRSKARNSLETEVSEMPARAAM